MQMGMRLWIKTATEPEFNLRVQWQFLNQKAEVGNESRWFFQDECASDISLHAIAGLKYNDPHGTLQRLYAKNPMEIVVQMLLVTPDMIDKSFEEAWERPLPYWDAYRTLSIAYVEAKLRYLDDLASAGIVDVLTDLDFKIGELDDKLPAWYHYRYTGPEKRIERIPGRVSHVTDL